MAFFTSVKDTAAGQGGVGVKQLGRDVKSPRVIPVMFVLRCDYRQPGEHNWKKADRKGLRICLRILGYVYRDDNIQITHKLRGDVIIPSL